MGGTVAPKAFPQPGSMGGGSQSTGVLGTAQAPTGGYAQAQNLMQNPAQNPGTVPGTQGPQSVLPKANPFQLNPQQQNPIGTRIGIRPPGNQRMPNGLLGL